jgi:hypothetical protein
MKIPSLALAAAIAVPCVLARPLTEVEVQAVFDSAVRDADRISVEHELMPWCHVPEGKSRLTQVGDISSKQEIEAAGRCVRLKVPAATREIIDGKECWARESFVVDTAQVFRLRFFRAEGLLLELHVLGPDSVGSESLVEDSAIHVDKEAFAPLYARLENMLREKIEALQPTPGAPDLHETSL